MNNAFEEIRSRLDVVDVLGTYLDLKNNGQNFKARCPFHSEKSPSLIVSPSKNIWHCFGCGLGGDIFKFVALIENTDTAGSLRILAKRANVQLQPLKKRSDKEQIDFQNRISLHEQGLKYLTWSANLYNKILLNQLQNSETIVYKYCKERNLELNTIKKYLIGYAPTANFIFNLAQKHTLDIDLLVQIGVLKKDERGIRDKFVDRLMIPVCDKTNQVIGFTGRIFPSDSNPNRPKYLNSSQSQWFNKSQLWYGWSQNSINIRRQKKAIIVEGNMDVVKASQFGFDYTLASQGTSFTIDQLKILKSVTDTVWLAFDNDEAGQTSSYKFYCQATQLGLNVYKLDIPKDFKDFDEALSAGYKFESVPIHFVEYYIQNTLNNFSFASPVEKDKKIKTLLDLIAHSDIKTTELNNSKVLSPLQKAYVSEISRYTGWKEADLESQFLLYRDPKLLSNEQLEVPKQLNFKSDFKNKLISNFKILIGIELDLSKLKNAFDILQTLFEDLQSFDSLESYTLANQNEIDLILQNITPDDLDKNALWKIIISYIDQNISRIMLIQDLKAKYLYLKAIDRKSKV